jgi:hypothetical protein
MTLPNILYWHLPGGTQKNRIIVTFKDMYISYLQTKVL